MQAVEENENSFTELIHFIMMKQRSVKELILAQEDAAVKQVYTLLDRLEHEIADLRSTGAELQHLEQLSQADNDIYFLQVSTSTSTKARILKR